MNGEAERASTPFELDLARLREAATLAEPMIGRTWPNPPVGCLLVEPGSGRVVGRGAHRKAGEAHAEALALQEAAGAAKGAWAYVTLEPCNHRGRTPPCAAALYEAGITRVVYAVEDPHDQAAGGAEALRQRGLEVLGPERLREWAAGLEADSYAREQLAEVLAWCEAQLGPFLSWHRRGRPWVVAKWAMSLDGRIATHTGEAKWITGEAARLDAQHWRARLGAVAVGIGTALADDPRLSYRGTDAELPQPKRLLIDTQARLPLGARLLRQGREPEEPCDPGPVLIAVGEASCAQGEAAARARQLEAAGATVLRVPEANVQPAQPGVNVAALLEILARDYDLMGLLLEGGATLLGSAFDAGLVDYAVCYLAPLLIGGTHAPGPIAGGGIEHLERAASLKQPSITPIGQDWRITGPVTTP